MKIIRFLALLALLLFVALSMLLQGQGIESTLQEPQLNSSKNYFEIIMENIGVILSGLGAVIAAYASYSALRSKISAKESENELDKFSLNFRDQLLNEHNIKHIKNNGHFFSESDPKQLERFIMEMIVKTDSTLRNTIERNCFMGGTLEVEAKKMQTELSSKDMLGAFKEVLEKSRT
jgi:hypothetical protein